MKFDLEKICSMTEANQNFSKVSKKVKKEGNVIIMKNNKPKFIIFDLDNFKKTYGIDDFHEEDQ